MWVLFIMSLVGSGEGKVTFYNDYKSEEICKVALNNLEKDFASGEAGTCYFVEYLKPKN